MIDNTNILNSNTNLHNSNSNSKNINIINEEKEIFQLLNPVKIKINEINASNGPIPLLSSILELFYDKKRKIMSKNNLLKGIENKIKNNIVTDFVDKIIYYVDSKNYIEKVFRILKYDIYFKILYINEEEFIQLNIKNIKKNLPIIIKDLIEQNDILTYKSNISIELEEEKIKKEKTKLFESNKIINNNDINFNNIHNNKIIINADIEKKEINNKVINILTNIKNNKDNNNNKQVCISDNTLNNNKKINQNLENENKSKGIMGMANTDLNNLDKIDKNDKKDKNLNKTFLKKKKKKPKENTYIIPNSFFDSNNHSNTIATNSFSSLSIESLSFSFVARVKDNYLLDDILNLFSYKNEKLISMFNGDNIKEREEKKIRELKQEISQKNIEIKLKEYIIQCWENANYNIESEKNNATLLDQLGKDIKNIYKRLEGEMEILYASHFIINKRNKLKIEMNNAEGIKEDFIYNYNICVELFKNLQNNKQKYLSCLDNINEFINNVNKIVLSFKEEKNTKKKDAIIYGDEKKNIDEIIECLKAFEDLIKNKIYDYIKNTPYENQINNNDENDLCFIKKI